MSAHRPPLRLIAAALTASICVPATAADLLGVYQRAQEEDPQFTTARSEYRAAREAMPQARAAVLPQVSLSASVNEREVTDGNTTESGSSNEASLSVTQTLFNWSQFAGLGQAEAQVAQAEAQFAAAEQNLITRVANAYFEVLAAADNLRFAGAEKRAIERQLEQAQERFEVGVIPITDVKAAQASYDLAVSREIDADNRLANAREALRTILGEPPGTLAELGEGLRLEAPDPTEPEAWVEQATERNPNLLAARAGADAARQGIRVTRGGHYPNVELIGSYSEGDSDFGQGADGADEETRVGVQLTWPLFSGGATFSEVDEAQAQFGAQRSRVVEAHRSASQSTRDAFRGVQASISQVRALEQAVESNQAAVEAARAGFEAGTRTAVDVLQALRDLYAAQRDYADARYNYILNRLQLKQAAGTLTVEDVRLVNTWLSSPNG
ncbi:MAG: TolC family outer membrane protein [Halofilum sp. (in: g-proteobacteria)]